MSGFLKNILVVGICIGFAAVGYYLFFDGGKNDLANNSAVRQELIDKTQSFIERSAKLQQINIDQSFFTDQTFISLRSFSTPVPNQPLGRNDIFGDTENITNAPIVTSGE